MVDETSDPNPAETLLTPNTSRALDKVVIEKLTAKMFRRTILSLGMRSPLISAAVMRKLPPMIVLLAVTKSGVELSRANLRIEKFAPMSPAVRRTMAISRR